jgi:hypothetical protein
MDANMTTLFESETWDLCWELGQTENQTQLTLNTNLVNTFT